MIYAIGGYLVLAFLTGVFSNDQWFNNGGWGCKWYQAIFWPLYWIGVI